jgi:hypothetical protein
MRGQHGLLLTLRLSLPPEVLAIVRARAAASEVPLARWVGEVVESYVAGERCAAQHHAAPPLPLSGDREADEAE